MDEPRERLSPIAKGTIRQESQAREIPVEEKDVPIATTFLAATTFLLAREANKIYERDPDLRRALKREGIEGCRYKMLFGAHSVTDGLYKQLKEVDVITGELNYVVTEGANDTDTRVDLRTDVEVFWYHLSKLESGGVEGISNEVVEGSRNMAKLYREGKAFLVSEGTKVSQNPYGSMTSRTSGKYWRARTGILSLMALSAIAYDAKKAGITRREFLKLALTGVGYLALSKLYNAFKFTAIDQQYAEAAPNREISLVYSKIEEAADNLGGAYLSLTEDPLIAREFRRLHEIRNQGMVLNSLYLAHLLGKHKDFRQLLACDKKEVDIAFFAGGGHAAAKSEFCKGSENLQKSLRNTAKDVIGQYLGDLKAEVDEPGKLTTYYSDHLTAFACPSLSRKGGVTFEAQEKVKMPDSPAGIMYRELIVWLSLEKNPTRREALQTLLSQIVENQMAPHQSRDFLTIGIGVGQNTYKPIDNQTVRRRMIRSGVISSNVSPGNSEIEIYRNITTLSYPYGDEREVGVVIVNGVPFPFFSKEDVA